MYRICKTTDIRTLDSYFHWLYLSRKVEKYVLSLQCCQIIFQKVAQTGVKRRTTALPRRAHFCVLNFAYEIGKNVPKLAFCNMLHLQNNISTTKKVKKLTFDRNFSRCFCA